MSREFEYLLNAMENASAQDDPHLHGYGDKRKAVLAYVAKLEPPRSPAQSDAVELLRELLDALDGEKTGGNSTNEMSVAGYSQIRVINARLAARAFLRGGSGG